MSLAWVAALQLLTYAMLLICSASSQRFVCLMLLVFSLDPPHVSFVWCRGISAAFMDADGEEPENFCWLWLWPCSQSPDGFISISAFPGSVIVPPAGEAADLLTAALSVLYLLSLSTWGCTCRVHGSRIQKVQISVTAPSPSSSSWVWLFSFHVWEQCVVFPSCSAPLHFLKISTQTPL